MDRPPPPPIPKQADERTMLLAFLDNYRADLLDRAWGLDATQLQQTLPPSSLSIGRLLSHMAMVEYNWFKVRLDGEEMHEIFSSLDWDADRDAEMTLSSTMSVDELVTLYKDAIADSDARIAAADSLDQLSTTGRDGEPWSLRWILIHMVEEYARHCGHADLIRESIDGDVCE